MARVMSKQDREWQAEEDAHTLARAAEIKRDKRRAARAVKAAKKKAADAAKEVKAVTKQAGVKRKK